VISVQNRTLQGCCYCCCLCRRRLLLLLSCFEVDNNVGVDCDMIYDMMI
jgi:hypothetical protein